MKLSMRHNRELDTQQEKENVSAVRIHRVNYHEVTEAVKDNMN